jgi:hypothetical protein
MEEKRMEMAQTAQPPASFAHAGVRRGDVAAKLGYHMLFKSHGIYQPELRLDCEKSIFFAASYRSNS